MDGSLRNDLYGNRVIGRGIPFTTGTINLHGSGYRNANLEYDQSDRDFVFTELGDETARLDAQQTDLELGREVIIDNEPYTIPAGGSVDIYASDGTNAPVNVAYNINADHPSRVDVEWKIIRANDATRIRFLETQGDTDADIRATVYKMPT